jgi:hypothetical protein
VRRPDGTTLVWDADGDPDSCKRLLGSDLRRISGIQEPPA